MTTTRARHRGAAMARRFATVALALGVSLGVAACTGVTYAPTPVPAAPTVTDTGSPGGSTQAPTCDNPTQTYDPLPSVPTSASITDAKVREILARGHLVVGVSADTYLLGARNPLTGRLEGFDTDLARAVAESLFGDPGKVQFRVITAADRLPVLENGEVDMVARNMTMNCDRWESIAFSAEYYHSGQKVLVADSSEAESLEDLDGERVCAPARTTSLEKLRSVRGPIPVTAENHTGCLVLFQQGQADAITGDDTVLAGLAAQDPYTRVTKAPAITHEPYGLGFNKDDVYLVRYVNALLEDMKADGRWKQIYDRWLASTLGAAPAPPKPVYGRS